jgi:hypothetical protein
LGTHIEAENCCVGLFAAQIVPFVVDDGDELGFRGVSNLPDYIKAIPENARGRKLREMDWKAFAK